MRYAAAAVLAGLFIAGLTGCQSHRNRLHDGSGRCDECAECDDDSACCGGVGCEGCSDCEATLGRHKDARDAGGGHAQLRHFKGPPQGPAGPPTATVAYPYYTTRGPRDFLASEPPNLGR